MACSVTLDLFNIGVEDIDDYKEGFDFHCTANQVANGCQKTLFLTRIGRDAFLKLKTSVSPTQLSDLSLHQIIMTMRDHFRKDTMEIAERLSFSNECNKTTKELPSTLLN